MTRRSLSPSHLEVWSPAQDPYTSYLTPRSTARACHLVYSASADREVERLHQVRAMLENAVVECGRSGPFHERSRNEEEENEHHREEGSWRSPSSSFAQARSSPPKATTTATTAATTTSMSSKRGVSFRGFDVDVSYQPSILDDGGGSTARAAADGRDNGGVGGGSAESNGSLLEGEPQEVELEDDAADGDCQAGLPSTSQDPRARSLMTTNNSSPSAGGSHDLAACSSSFSSPALLGIGDTRRHSSLVAFNAATSLLVTRQFESIGRKECLYMEMVDRHELYQQFSRRLRRLERHAFDQEQRALLFIVQKQNADAMTLRAEASASLQELESRHRCALEQMLTEKITIFSEASRSLQNKVQFVETTTAMFVIMTAETEARRRIEADELFAAAPASPSESQVMEGDDGDQPAGAEQGQDPLVVLQEGRSRIALHELAARLEISYREKNRLHHAETVADRARQLQQHHHHHEVEEKEDMMITNDRISLRAGVQKAKSLEEVLSTTSLSVQSLKALMAPPVGMKGDADDPVATFAGAARGNQPTPTRKPYGRVPSPTTTTAAAHQRSGSPATALPLRPIPRSPSAAEGRRSPAQEKVQSQPKAQSPPVQRGRAPSPPVAPATGMGNSTRTSPLPPAAPPLRAPSPTTANTAKSLQQFARVRPQSPPRSDPQQQQQKSETVALPVNSSSSSTARRNSAVTSPAARKSTAGRTPSPTAATKPKSNPSPPPPQSQPSPTPLTTQPPRSTGGSASSAHRGTDVTRTRSPANTLATSNNTPSRTLDDEEEEEAGLASSDHKVAGRRSSSGNPAVIAVGSPIGDGVVITDELLAAAEVDSDGDDDDDDDDLDHRGAADLKSAQTATASASPQRQRTISMRARRDVAAAQRRAMLSFLQRSLQASASKQQLQQGAGNGGSPAGSSRNLRLVRAPSSLALPPPTLPHHGWLLRCSTGAHVGWNRRYFCVTRTGKLRMTNADPQEAIEQYLRRMRKQQQQAPSTAVHDVPNVLTLVKWTTLARVEHITDVDFDCCTAEKCGGARLPPHVESSHGFVVDLRVGEEGQHHHASVNVVSRIRLCCYSKKDRNEWVQTLRRVVQLTKEFHVQEQ